MKRFISSLVSFSLSAVLCAQAVLAVPSAITNVQTADETQFEEFTYTEDFLGEQDNAVLSGPSFTIKPQTAEETVTGNARPKTNDAVLFGLLEGEGTEQSPYLISDAIDLFLFANNVNTGVDSDKHYKLTADIDLGGDEWIPIGSYTPPASQSQIDEAYKYVFTGVFDGNGYTISNFVITNADTPYVGFFGFACNATIKNLTIDNAHIDVASTDKNDLYVSVLVGRVTTRKNNSKATLENCKVTNSSINASGIRSVYAGAICGIAVADGDEKNTVSTSIEATLLNAECDITASTAPETEAEYYITAGGIFGYYGAMTNSEIVLKDAHYSGIIMTDSTSNSYTGIFAGGVVGGLVVREKTYYKGDDIDYVVGGTAHVSSCSSQGTVVAKALLTAYSGGFAGYIDTTVNTYINDCYSSADCSADDYKRDCVHYPKCKNVCEYICVGGFAGYIPFHGFSSSFPKTFINCYASGDAIDLEVLRGTTPELENSYAGSIFGYSEADIFANTYKLSSQEVLGREIPTDLIPVLDETAAKKASSYEGFDFDNIWEINPYAAYPYPTLREKITYAVFINEDEVFNDFAIGTSGRVVAPSEIPEKEPTTELKYTFKHWSLEKDGEAFDFEESAVFEKTYLYAVYETSARTYTINYYSEGEKFIPEAVLPYGTPITQTSLIPTKEETAKFAYVFSHWSEIANGQRVDFTNLICDRDYTFYAVFTEIDKTAWGGEVADGFSGGNGSAALPYKISSSEEFALLSKLVNEGDAHYSKANYILNDDINLGNNFWVPIGTADTPFSGVLDGNGYTIRNYKISASQYAGLFGYILNGSVKNLTLSNFEITFSYTTSDNVYVGGVSGYVLANEDKDSVISNVCVSSKEYDITLAAKNIYAGGFVGYGEAYAGSEMLVENSYTRTPIKVKNNNGYVYLGGIAGYLNSGSASKANIKYCYSTADLTGYAVNNSCRVGGLVGSIFSNGNWTPDIGNLSGSLSASDIICMISNSFSVANLSSYSEKNMSQVGRIVSTVSLHASCDEDSTFYLSKNASKGIITVSPEDETIEGSGTSLANLKSKDYLINNMGFDFENVWLEDESGFPVLKVVTSDKPVFGFTDVLLEGNSLTVSVEFLSKYSDVSTIVFVVKNARNQAIKIERVDVTNTGVVKEITREFENLSLASSVSVSAIDKQNLVPLFPELKSDL